MTAPTIAPVIPMHVFNPTLRAAAGLAVRRGLTWLLRDEFTTDAAAPLASPRTCEPGPGTLTVIDSANAISVSGGDLVASSPASQSGFLSGVFVRTPGRALLLRVTQYHHNVFLGWGTNTVGTGDVHGFTAASSGNYALRGTGVGGPVSDLGSLPYDLYFVMRSQGAFVFGGGKLLWVYADASAYNYVKARIEGSSRYGSLRVADLGAPLSTDYGLATSRDTSVAANDTGAHEANALLVLENVTRPSGASLQFLFRSPDASNGMILVIQPAGDIQLRKVTGGVLGSSLASVGGFPASGARVVLTFDGNVYRAYVNGTLAWTYTDAANSFLTDTTWRTPALGTGGAVGEIQAWPRTPSGAALAQLNLLAA